MSKTRILRSSLHPIEFLRRISNETAPSSLPFKATALGSFIASSVGPKGALDCYQ